MSEGLKLFIGGLSLETDTESVRGYFEQFGELGDCIAMVDPTTKKYRGFGFVTFTERSAYDSCLSQKEHTIDGRTVEVKRAVPRNELGHSRPVSTSRCKKIFLGGMSVSSTAEEVQEAIEKVCGVGVVDKVDIMTDKYTNKPRGFTFVYFKDEEDIYPIVDQLLSRKYVSIGGRDVEVKPAIPLDQMKRDEEKRKSYHSSSRDGDYSRRPMYDDCGPSSGAGGYSNYGGWYGDYPPQRGAGRDYMSAYPSMYNRPAGSGYSYESNSASSYPYGGKNGGYGAMMGGGYAQSATSYGPTRGYSDYGRDRGDRNVPYHYPFPRQQ